MLDQIEKNTGQLKLYLIQLGFFLTPPTPIHINKLTHINRELQEMSDILTQTHAEGLFDNVSRVAIAITTIYYTIESLADVNRVIFKTKQYVESYLK